MRFGGGSRRSAEVTGEARGMDETRRNILKGFAGLSVLGCSGMVQAAPAAFGNLPSWLQKLIKEKGDTSKTTLYKGPFPDRGAGNYTVTTGGSNSIFAYPDTFSKGSQISREIKFDFKAPVAFGFKPKETDMSKLAPDEQETVALIIQKTNDVFWASRYFPDGRPTDREVQNGEAIGILSTEVSRIEGVTNRPIERVFQTRGITNDKEQAVCRVVGVIVSTAEMFVVLGMPTGGAPPVCNSIVGLDKYTSVYHGTNRYNQNVREAQGLAWIYTRGFRERSVRGALESLKRIQANECPELGSFSSDAIKILAQLETFGEGIIKQISRIQPRDLVWKEPAQQRNQMQALRK